MKNRKTQHVTIYYMGISILKHVQFNQYICFSWLNQSIQFRLAIVKPEDDMKKARTASESHPYHCPAGDLGVMTMKPIFILNIHHIPDATHCNYIILFNTIISYNGLEMIDCHQFLWDVKQQKEKNVCELNFMSLSNVILSKVSPTT